MRISIKDPKGLLVAVIAFLLICSCLMWREISVAKSKLNLIESIIDSHADDGVCDELVNELNEVGYYDLH